MKRVFNFSPGPAMLPTEVLEIAQSELLDWHGTGMSVMEISHRGSHFTKLVEESETDFRELLNIPKNYKVLFLGGSASNQFAMIPLNLLSLEHPTADYVDTGQWSQKAIDEASRYGSINVAARTIKNETVHILPYSEWNLNPNAAYLHYTANETIDGIEFHDVPQTGKVPLVTDMSSSLLSQPIDVSAYGVIYAGAQKNISCAGLTFVIIREDLLKDPMPHTPTLYNYKFQAANQSLYTTPPTYTWYLAGLVFKWLKKQGGLSAMAQINQRKADKLYQFIDQSHFYSNSVDPSCRSRMNIPFSLKDESLNDVFLAESNAVGLTNLKGHRLVGGMRASIYNAMPEAGVDALIEFMDSFAKKHQS